MDPSVRTAHINKRSCMHKKPHTGPQKSKRKRATKKGAGTSTNQKAIQGKGDDV